VAELADHDVEGGVGIRQRLGVALGPDNGLDLRDARVRAGLVEQAWREVEAGHARAGARGGDGHHTGARPHVEDVLTRRDAGKRDELTGDRCGEDGRGREGGPHLPLAGLEPFEGIRLSHAMLPLGCDYGVPLPTMCSRFRFSLQTYSRISSPGASARDRRIVQGRS
jgi:hypothetical protein